MTQAKQVKRCKGTKGEGKYPCNAVPGASGYCFMHDPDRGAERAAARRRGGRGRHTPHSDAALPSTEIRTLDDVRGLLGYALAEALVGDNSIQRTRALVAIAGAFVEAIKVGELEQRLAALEAAQKVEGSK